MKARNFRVLIIWRLGKEIVLDIYLQSRKFPKQELYGLTSQIRRSVVSIPSNIAEGFNRSQIREYRRFLLISLGSCAELETQTEIAFDLNYLDDNNKTRICNKINCESKMIRNLIKKLDKTINQ
jgi:four helix bundle protein